MCCRLRPLSFVRFRCGRVARCERRVGALLLAEGAGFSQAACGKVLPHYRRKAERRKRKRERGREREEEGQSKARQGRAGGSRRRRTLAHKRVARVCALHWDVEKTLRAGPGSANLQVALPSQPARFGLAGGMSGCTPSMPRPLTHARTAAQHQLPDCCKVIACAARVHRVSGDPPSN